MSKSARGFRVRISKATAGDAAVICELLFGLKSQYGSCAERGLKAFRKRYIPAIRKAIGSPQHAVWVARIGGAENVVGFISFTRRLVVRLAGDVAVLEEIFIRPGWRRRGIGFRLWQKAAAELRAKGIRTVEVVSSLAHPGQRQFAEKIGYEWYANIHRISL